MMVIWIRNHYVIRMIVCGYEWLIRWLDFIVRIIKLVIKISSYHSQRHLETLNLKKKNN